MVFSSNELDMLILQHGTDGKPANSLYTWVKYSKNPDGSDLTDDPNGAVYMGIANNKEEARESTNPADYTWIKIKGEEGVQGQSGYTVILTNENISISVSNDKLTSSEKQTFATNVIVMRGIEEVVDFSIGEILNQCASISTTVNKKTIELNVDKGKTFDTNNGYIRIPIIIGGITIYKDISWNLVKQGGVGVQGEPAPSIYLGNEMQAIPCNADGTVYENILITIPFAGYLGFDMVDCKVNVGLLPEGMTLGENTSSTSTQLGKIILNIAKGSSLGNKNVLNGEINLTFIINNKSMLKKFSWVKTKEGGMSTVYNIEPSSFVISKNFDNTFSPSTINFESFYQKNDIPRTSYKGRFIIEETTNGSTYSSKYLSANDESFIVYTPSSSNVLGIRCSLYEQGGIVNLLDRRTITVLTDIDNLKPVITEINKTISGVDTKVDAVNKSITDKVWQTDIETQINSYDNSTIKGIRDQVSEHTTTIGKISSSVKDVESKLTTKADGSTVQSLTEKVAKVEQDANGFKQTVEKNYVTNDKLNQSTTTLRSEFTQSATQIQSQVTDLKGNITTLTENIDGITGRVETAEGDISQLKLEDGKFRVELGKKDDVIPSQIRYIRDYLNGNTINNTNYYCKIEVLSNETNLESGEVNLAKGIVPTSDVDIVNPNNYTDEDLDTYASTSTGNHYLQIDLSQSSVVQNGSVPKIDSITVWHYYKDRRMCNHKLQVSSNGKSWYTLYDSETQEKYKEMSDGKKYCLDDSSIYKDMSFIDMNIDRIEQRVQDNENNYSSISSEVDKVLTRVESVESTTNNVSNNIVPNLESKLNKKIAEIEVKADNITNSVTKIQGDIKQQGQEILEAGKWKVSLANIGGYDSKYADTEVFMELTPNGLTVSRSSSDGYRSQITGDTIRIDYDNGRGQYDNAMLIDRDLMHLTRVFVKNGIDHGTIKEIPQVYGKISGLVFIASAGSSS